MLILKMNKDIVTIEEYNTFKLPCPLILPCGFFDNETRKLEFLNEFGNEKLQALFDEKIVYVGFVWCILGRKIPVSTGNEMSQEEKEMRVKILNDTISGNLERLRNFINRKRVYITLKNKI